MADGAEFVIVLGDLLDYVDYYDPSGGVLGEVFGAERVQPLVEMRTRGDFEAFHAYERSLWPSVSQPTEVLEGLWRSGAKLFSACAGRTRW